MSKDNQEHKSKPKQFFKNLLRISISIIAFICLIKFGKIDLHTAFKYLLKVNPVYFILAYLSYLITVMVAGLRFYFSSHAVGFQRSYFQLLQLNFVGAFFNNFLPTTFGGDALRGYYLKKGSSVSLSRAAACIVYERYTGMIVLFWLLSLAFILQYLGFIGKSSWSLPNQIIIFCHIGSFITIFLVPFLPQVNKLIFGKSNWLYQRVLEPVLVYWNDMKLTFKIIALSFVLQFFVILSHYFIALSLNIEIPLSYYLVFYPLTTLAGFMIPSLNGLGIREGAYIYFLKIVSVSNEQGLAFSIGWLIVLLITSFIGGVIYMIGDFHNYKPLQEVQES